MNRIRKVEGENIIIVTNNVQLTTEVIEENRSVVRAYLQEMVGPVVILIDYREVKTSFADIIQIMRHNQAGSRKDLNERTFTIFVGTDKLISLLRDSMRLPQFGNAQVPYFDDYDKALQAARIYLAKGRSDSEFISDDGNIQEAS